MNPVFAVVGQPNKGKSSIVATLAENESIAISQVPGTTRVAERHQFRIEGDVLYELVDTPGFQRARAVLEWLQAGPVAASQRAGRVAEFVREHRDQARFVDECELLAPIVAGAGILYVVDGAKPYGAEFEVEMQVLRWTGRPRMALINRIGPGDHVAEWREALGQYFSIVREFDAMHADFDKRIALLRGFTELDQSYQAPLARAIEALQADHDRRLERSAELITDNLIRSLGHTRQADLREGMDRSQQDESLRDALMNDLRRFESESRDAVQRVYQHDGLRRVEGAGLSLDSDLFTQEGWEIFGLSRSQLLWSGVATGAVAGSGIDLILGGASLLLGAGIGAVLGGAGTWFGSEELAKIKLLGQSLGGRTLRIGPISAPNFPWVLLGRSWLHFTLVSERNHARREALELSVAEGAALMDRLPGELRNELRVLFKDALENDGGVRAAMKQAVAKVLRTEAKSS